jgi:hypothetical protein
VKLRFLVEYDQKYAGRYIGWFSKRYTQRKLDECLANMQSSLEVSARKAEAKEEQRRSLAP